MANRAPIIYLIPIVMVLATLGLLLPNLPPGLTFVDCGQLCAAAWGLGIPHPSGYPLWCLWTRLGIGATPGLDATVCVAMFSALMTSLSTGLLAFLGIRLGAGLGWNKLWSAVGGIAAAVAAIGVRVVLEQAVIAEVYSLHLFFFILLLLLALSPQKTPPLQICFAFLSGLGLTNHSSLVLPLIPLAVITLQPNFNLKRLPLLFLAFLLGLSVWLYLPLRSSTAPVISWGWPDCWERFWEHATRAGYGGMQLYRLPYLFLHLGRMFSALPEQLGWLLFPFPLLGLGFLWRGKRSTVWLLLLVLIMTGPVAAFFLTLMLQPHQVSEFLTWLAPFYLLIGFLSGWGLISLVRWVLRRINHRTITPIGIAIALGLAGSPWVQNLPQIGKAGYYFAEDYGHNLLSTLSFRSVYVLELRGSLGAFESTYLVKVRQLRPDYHIADTTATVFTDRSYYKTFHNLSPGLQEQWRQDNEKKALLSGLECYYNFRSLAPEDLGFSMIYDGMLFHAIPGSKPATDNLAPYQYYRLRGLDHVPADDEWALEAAVQYFTNRGIILWRLGRRNEGQAQLDEAHQLAHGATWSLAAIGEGYIYIQEWEKAAQVYAEALTALPPELHDSPEFRSDVGGMYLNLAITRHNSGDETGARQAFGQVARICPELLR